MKIPLTFLLAISTLVTWGCGYRFQPVTVPEPTIEIPLFENRTVETGIEASVTDEFLDELRKMAGWRIVPPGAGHYRLEGTILKFTSDPLFLSKQHLAEQHRATLVLRTKLRDASSGRDLWEETFSTNFADYDVGPDILANERNKLEAITRIAEELAARVRARIQAAW